jgi:peptidyl-prolyl cis-trans isomerase B (cyclophilin B)
MMQNRGIGWLLGITLLLVVPSILCQDQSPASGRLIRIETPQGEMLVKLYDQTPAHRDNMIKLINEGFYDGQIFHRVIKDFMIQGGDPHSAGAERGQRLGTGGPGYTIPAEINDRLYHKKGALAAARTGDQFNPEKASSGSQFYIVQGRVFTSDMLEMLQRSRSVPFSLEAINDYTTIGGTPHLDGAYTVFGEVIEGLDVVDRIANLPTDANDRPLEDMIYHITLE